MIEAKRLLADLQKLAKKLEDDLRQRCKDNREVDDRVRAEYGKAKGAGRTSQAYEAWRDEFITQSAIAWILGCVFVRFLEDNQLVETPRLAGAGERLNRARDQHQLYFRGQPTHSDREYLESVFRETAKLPAMRELFDERHNPLWTLGLTGDGATLLLNFWQQIDPASGALVHDFIDAEWNTRFLGDLYQDLSEAARKKYALLQTPIFVEEFILDRTLTPAIDEFGYQGIRLIDPACGSGHFLLGAFDRLFNLAVMNEPSANPRVLAQQALSSVHGVDLNPYAVAIARFRLLLAALKASGVARLKDAPDFKINLAVGDSLLHGEHSADQLRMGWHPIAHVYETEDIDQLNRILRRNHYHAVVGNPPYITVKDAALNKAYRERFGSCHRQYSLAVPFMERFFDLAVNGNSNGHAPAGFIGMITANSFMKREFGKRLIETYIPRWDMTQVIDTSGAYIPGHGTPTVILFGRNRQPVADMIRTVMGIRGEPSTPVDAAHGQVWTAIVSQLGMAGSQSDFVSVADSARSSFHKHPWSIGGGGAAELKELLDEVGVKRLNGLVSEVGYQIITGEDNCLILGNHVPQGLRFNLVRQVGIGEDVRDWLCTSDLFVTWPNSSTGERLSTDEIQDVLDFLWPYRELLRNRKAFGIPVEQKGIPWWAIREVYTDKISTPLSIVYSEVATHNHFVLGRSMRVFTQTAPVIKLPAGTSEAEHHALLGLFNSSTGCFWLRLVSHWKGNGGINEGLRTELWEQFIAYNGTKIKQFPIPEKQPTALARALDQLAQELQNTSPALMAERAAPNKDEWQQAEQRAAGIRSQMIAFQEELDWQCYKLYGLTSDELTLPIEQVPPMQLGERAFEIVMARRMAAGELETTWFDRHGSTPITEIPAHWPDDYRALVARRIAMIESDRNIALIEQPEYKRRWNSEPWAAQQERALREWLLNRLEDARYWTELQLTSCARLADLVRKDAEFMQVAEFYRGRKDFDLTALVSDLVRSEAVPFLPVLRYKESGLRNRDLWERAWELQRQEDAIDARTRLPEGDPQRLTVDQATQLKHEQIGDIPVPPKYKSADFQDTVYWRLRGKLDVPKERFISYPYCHRAADPTPVIAWAGWNHLQQAQAIAAYYELARTNEGWSNDRLVPLLAGLLELVPWLLQWHNEIDPVYGTRMGDYFKTFVEEEARGMQKTVDEIRAWRPQAAAGRR